MSAQELCIAAIIVQGFVLGFILRDTQSKRTKSNRAVNLILLPFIIAGLAMLLSYAIDLLQLQTLLAAR